MRRSLAETIIRLSYPDADRERRVVTLVIALGFVAVGTGIRRLLDLPPAPAPEVPLPEQVRRLIEDPSW